MSQVVPIRPERFPPTHARLALAVEDQAIVNIQQPTTANKPRNADPRCRPRYFMWRLQIGGDTTPESYSPQVPTLFCRSKMRMSGLSKVEMSAFMGGRGPYGNGANCFEPTRTGPATRATRDKAEADHPERSCQTTEDQRPAHSSFAG